MQDARQVEAVGQRQRLGVDLRPADDEHLLALGEEFQRPGKRMRHAASGDVDPLAGDDDIFTVRERPPERLPGLAPHHDGMARREGLEVFQVLGDVPQKGVPVADHAVCGHGYNDAYHRFQNDMGALIAGQGSYPSSVKSS